MSDIIDVERAMKKLRPLALQECEAWVGLIAAAAGTDQEDDVWKTALLHVCKRLFDAFPNMHAVIAFLVGTETVFILNELVEQRLEGEEDANHGPN